ncbi:MAG: hypothetical protein WD266_04900 [Balneolales bacterium]
MKIIAGCLIITGLVLIPLSLIFPTLNQANIFLIGASALGFGAGLLLAAKIMELLGFTRQLSSPDEKQEGKFETGNNYRDNPAGRGTKEEKNR